MVPLSLHFPGEFMPDGKQNTIVKVRLWETNLTQMLSFLCNQNLLYNDTLEQNSCLFDFE